MQVDGWVSTTESFRDTRSTIEQVAWVTLLKNGRAGPGGTARPRSGADVKGWYRRVFDTRVLHRGLQCQYAQPIRSIFYSWPGKHNEQHMFQPSRLCGNPRDKAHQKKNGYFSLCRVVYQSQGYRLRIPIMTRFDLLLVERAVIQECRRPVKP
jgi:hypothetical protein